jgi:hypothetical protein
MHSPLNSFKSRTHLFKKKKLKNKLVIKILFKNIILKIYYKLGMIFNFD